MTRLIDAYALDKVLDEVISRKGFTVEHEGGDTEYVISLDDIRHLIPNAPTVQQSEPFGYFKAEPFGWTDCAETDEGAIALYEAPTVQREGWVSVPIEPTEEMIDAAQWEDGKQTAINVYKLMLEAAPKE